MICYIPSFDNSDAVVASVGGSDGLPAVVADNASAAPHRDRLATLAAESKGRVQLVVHPRNIGRVANWEFCVRHFLGQGQPWMKWVFAGDTLRTGAAETLRSAAEAYPTARMIVAEYDEVHPGHRVEWSSQSQTRLMSPVESMRLAATGGNWFGPPIAHAFHREGLSPDARFSDLPWVADALFALDVAEKHPVLYLKQRIGEFQVATRKYFSSRLGSTRSFFEDGIFRTEAAERYRRLSGDEAGYGQMMAGIELWMSRRGVPLAPVKDLTLELARRAKRGVIRRRRA